VDATKQPAVQPAARVGLLERLPLLSKLANPPVLAGVLGLLALAIISFLWVMLAGSEDVEGVRFPAQGLAAEPVPAPAPGEYQAKKTALQAYGLGNRQAHLGKFEEAIQEYQRASSIDPGYPHPHRAMGSIYAALGKPELSRAAYETYLQLEPRSPDAAQVRLILKRYQAK
jgi:tetratricopeptide (TPR) repeat protein